MAKLPSMQFYPGDWLKDPALRCCSAAARGVWIDLLCMMFEAPQRGVLRTKNCSKMNAISIKILSNSIADCTPKLIQELIDNGVVRVARKDGALYSKRLVRDELHRRHKAVNGKKGGKQTGSKPEANPQAKRGSSTSTSSSTSVSIPKTKVNNSVNSKEQSLSKKGLDNNSSKTSLVLGLKFWELFEKKFSPMTDSEKTTFHRLATHLAQSNTVYEDVVEAVNDSRAGKKRAALFVTLCKDRFGFSGTGKVVKKGRQ